MTKQLTALILFFSTFGVATAQDSIPTAPESWRALRPVFGVTPFSPPALSANTGPLKNAPQKGVLAYRVVADSAFEEAGLKNFDRIISVAGKSLTPKNFYQTLAKLRPGKQYEAIIERAKTAQRVKLLVKPKSHYVTRYGTQAQSLRKFEQVAVTQCLNFAEKKMSKYSHLGGLLQQANTQIRRRQLYVGRTIPKALTEKEKEVKRLAQAFQKGIKQPKKPFPVTVTKDVWIENAISKQLSRINRMLILDADFEKHAIDVAKHLLTPGSIDASQALVCLPVLSRIATALYVEDYWKSSPMAAKQPITLVDHLEISTWIEAKLISRLLPNLKLLPRQEKYEDLYIAAVTLSDFGRKV